MLSGTNPDWIEQLTKRLDSDDALWVAWELGRQGKAAARAVEPLRRLAGTAKTWQIKAMAVAAAWRIDPSSPEPINLITSHLSQPGTGQFEIVRLLGELGLAARSAVPTLRQLRYSRGVMMHDRASEVLQIVAPEYVINPWQK